MGPVYTPPSHCNVNSTHAWHKRRVGKVNARADAGGVKTPARFRLVLGVTRQRSQLVFAVGKLQVWPQSAWALLVGVN
jgi:hypothetical protein